MLFTLKKCLGLLVVPLSLILASGALGAVLLWRTKWARSGRWLVTLAVAGLILFSNRGVATLLLQPLESAHAPMAEGVPGEPLPRSLAQCEAIVVLGSGNSADPALSSLQRLNPAALANLAQAVRLARLLPAARIVVSGSHGPGRMSHAQVMAEGAVSLGVSPHRIARMDTTLDTHDEVVEATRRLGSTPFVLVTSAAHLPRAMALFKRAGARAFPCPAYFLTSPSRLNPGDFLAWEAEALEGSRKSIKERVGLLWARLRGQAD